MTSSCDLSQYYNIENIAYLIMIWQVCIIPLRRKSLIYFNEIEETELEKIIDPWSSGFWKRKMET